MARLRHIAVVVKDLDKAAAFYQDVFDLKRVGREDLDLGSAVYMTDGVINLALLNFKGKGPGSTTHRNSSVPTISDFRSTTSPKPRADRGERRPVLFRPRR